MQDKQDDPPCNHRKLSKAEQDDLEPVVPLDLSTLDSFDDLARAMGRTAFGGRQLGEAVDTLVEMSRDPGCAVVLTLSGAMTVAKMGLVICDMIDRGLVQGIVSTGALMAHGFVEATGLAHYKYREGMNDTELYEKGYNRVYDTLEPESNLEHVEQILKQVLEKWPSGETLSSRRLNLELGRYLVEHHPTVRGVLKSAYEKDVPVYVPAFSDSEIGLGVGIFNRQQVLRGKPRIAFDPFLDLEHFSSAVSCVPRIGIFTIGGGVPRNWAQQVGPYLELLERHLGAEGEGGRVRYHYGVRICPEPVHWGGLSGCTYSEGVSWGKFVPPQHGGRFAEVMSDATIAWPLVVKAALQRLEKLGGAEKKPKLVGNDLWKPSK